MVLEKIIDTIFGDLSGIKAREHVSHLIHHHRFQASPDFRKAAEYVHRQLEEFGFNNAQIMEFPADGKINQWDWESPIAWRAQDAELTMIEPFHELLCDFKEIPISLISHSQSASIEAELIDMGTGTDAALYRKDNIKDSIILATGAARDIYPLMVSHGVRGLLHYPTDIRAFDYPDLIAGDAFCPVDEDRGKIPFGFCIPKRQAEKLKELMADGKKVKLRAFVEAQLYDGNLDVVEAAIHGDDESDETEEVLMVAHLCNPKPSANDNASGSALMLEIARVLRKLITGGNLGPNRRTIRFLWLPEYSGAIAWLHWNFPRLSRITGCIILNAVGESPDRIGTPLRVSIPPYSTESYLEDLFGSVAEIVAHKEHYSSLQGSRRKLIYDLETFSGVSDHSIFIDRYFNIPSVMLGHDEPFMNTSYDIIENVDPTEMLRVGLIAATAAYGIATPDLNMARQFLLFQKAGSLNRINQFLKSAFLNVYNAQSNDIEMRFYNEVGKATFLIKREETNFESLFRYYPGEGFRDKVMEIKRSIKVYAFKELKSMEQALRERATELGYQIASLDTLPREYREAQILIPEKLVNAPFKGLFKKVIFQRLDGATKEWLRSNSLRRKSNVYGEIHNFINGENSIYDIYMAIDLQFGAIKLADLRNYIMLLHKWKLISIKMFKEEGRDEVIEMIEPEAPLVIEGMKEEFAPPRENEDIDLLREFALAGQEREAGLNEKPAPPAGMEAAGTMEYEGEEALKELTMQEAQVLEELEQGREAADADAAATIDVLESETFEALEELEAKAVQALESSSLEKAGSLHAGQEEERIAAHEPDSIIAETPPLQEPPPHRAPSRVEPDDFELDLESLELDLKKIVVKEASKPSGEARKVIVENMDGLDLDFEEIDTALKTPVKRTDDLDPDDLVIDFDRIKNDT